MDITGKIGLTQLRYFVALADELHFGRAATRLGVAQPFLSQKIKTLEEALGSPLFLRTSRRVELTEAGALFLPSARRSLSELSRGAARLEGLRRGEVGALDVGYVMIGMLMVVPDLLRAFRSSHPGITLALHEISTAPQVVQLQEEELDVGFLSQPVLAPGLQIHREWSQPFDAVLPSDHRLARRRSIQLRELAHEPFVSVTRHSSPEMHDRMMADLLAAGVTPTIVQEAGSLQATVNLVAAGMGVTIAPRGVSQLRIPGVTYRALSGVAPRYGLALCTRQGPLSPSVSAFVRLCVAAKVA